MALLRFKTAMLCCLVLMTLVILSCLPIDSQVRPATTTINPPGMRIPWPPCQNDLGQCETSNLPLLMSTSTPTPTTTSSPPTTTSTPSATTSTPSATSSALVTRTSSKQEVAFTMRELGHQQNEVKPRRGGNTKTTIRTKIRDVSEHVASHQSSSNPSTARAPQARRTVVLQVSLGRSGSSFVGQIMNAHDEIFYIFEPLSILLKRIASSESSSVERLDSRTMTAFLADIVTCNFHKQELVRRNFIRFVKWSLSNELSSKNHAHLKPRYAQEVCSRHRYMVIKLLSLRLPSNGILALQELFASLSHVISFKIVHLVRDPRAVLASWKRLKWKAAAHPKYMCEEVLRNVNVGRNSSSWLRGKYKLFLYEDFCLQPLGISKALFEFMGLRMDEGIKSRIRTLTAPVRSARPGAYSVVRNSTAMVNKWKTLPKPFLRTVQTACKGLIESLRYEMLTL